jgi:hypothetical protein
VGKFVTVMDDQFLILECMYINSQTEVVLPVTLKAPNLRHLMLRQACIPIGSPLLTTAAELTTLVLHKIPASAYFTPSYVFTQLLLMPQLEHLAIIFPNHDVERQFHQTPSITQVTLPNLHVLLSEGPATYLEVLFAQISTPSLIKLAVCIYCQHPFTVPHLLQFMKTFENLGFSGIKITFCEAFYKYAVTVSAEPPNNPPFELEIKWSNRDWPLGSSMRALGALSPVYSAVEQVTLAHDSRDQSSGWIIHVDGRQWRELLTRFTNVRTIHVHDDLVGNITRSLLSHDGDPPLELLPNLEEFEYSGRLNAWDALDLNAFVDARREAGHPVSLRVVNRSTSFDDSELDSFWDSDSDL